MKAVDELEREIRRREAELAILKRALATLKGLKAGPADAAHRGRRRPMTDAEKHKLSAALKKAWQKRRAAQKSNESGSKKAAAS
ncbi:MAG: hypothetical protein ACM3PU_10380 [Gemmatimonadota bacterium]